MAQIVTLGQALREPAAAQQGEAVKNALPKREIASAHLAAIYGISPGLRASLTLNGVVAEAATGDVLRVGKTACRLEQIELSARCVALGQASRDGDICPVRVCWTGQPLPPSVDIEHVPARSGRDLGMPPHPVPSPPSAANTKP